MFSFRVDEELSLALPLEQNAEEIYAVVRENLAQLKLWMPWATDDYSLESALWYVRNNLKELAENKGFAASLVVADKIVGQIGFHHFDSTNKSTHLGYWLARHAQGNGLMTRSCRVFINHAFNDLGLNRVQINCNVENVKSRAVAERLGFKLEGIHRQVERLNDEFHDWAVYAMLKKEWEN